MVMRDRSFRELGTGELLSLLLRLNRAELTLRFPRWAPRAGCGKAHARSSDLHGACSVPVPENRIERARARARARARSRPRARLCRKHAFFRGLLCGSGEGAMGDGGCVVQAGGRGRVGDHEGFVLGDAPKTALERELVDEHELSSEVDVGRVMPGLRG
jgi:hypothetical protein